MAMIPVYQKGQIIAKAVVDDEDYSLVSGYRWRLNKKGYVVTGSTPIYLHRLVCGLERGDSLEVDHKNREKLDNRSPNLRICTHALNTQNVPSQRDTSSRFRGVHWQAGKRKWKAKAHLDGRTYHLGYFDDENEAGRVATAWREANMEFFTP